MKNPFIKYTIIREMTRRNYLRIIYAVFAGKFGVFN